MGRARDMKRQVNRKIAQAAKEAEREAAAQAERDLRAGAKLEILDWHWGREYGYAIAEGRVKNISDEPLEAVEAVVEFQTSDEQLVKSGSSIIEYNPILPGQTSPFKVMTTHNPAMKTANIQFKELMGGTIPTYQKGR